MLTFFVFPNPTGGRIIGSRQNNGLIFRFGFRCRLFNHFQRFGSSVGALGCLCFRLWSLSLNGLRFFHRRGVFLAASGDCQGQEDKRKN